MDEWIVTLLNGISFGFILFLVAMGLSLVLGTMGILNLAHGAFYMIGGYVGLEIAGLGVNFWLAALAGGLAAVLVGLVIERGFLSRLHKLLNEQVLLTLGFVYILGNISLWIWGAWGKMGTVPSILSGSMSIGNLAFPVYRIAIIFIGLVFAAGLWWFQDKTRIGAIVRAGMDNKAITMALGVNYGLIATLVFVLGIFIAGVAGFLGAPILGINPGTSMEALTFALIVVIVGGMGSMQGTLVGGIVIGLVDAIGKALLPEFAMYTIYLAMIIVLLLRPSGLLARRGG